MSALVCRTQRRRELIQRHQQFNGLDYLEVSEDQQVLTVYFIDKTPVNITKDQIKITGGQKIQNIQVTQVNMHASEQLEYADYMEVTVDKPGDFSTYRLSVITPPHDDDGPVWPFDPYYSHLDFSFKVDCPKDMDCHQEADCPEPERVEPSINYLAKDYASFRQLLLDRLAVVMPDWQERHVPDIGIALVEVLAYVGDHLSYYQDAVATEAYLETARLRTSVRRHARLVDYHMHEGCNARAWVCIETDTDITLQPESIYFITRLQDPDSANNPVLSSDALNDIAASTYRVFEPMMGCPIALYQDHNTLHFYTWGQQQCCLETGATEATLYGQLITGCPVESDRDDEVTNDINDNISDEDDSDEPSVSHPQLKLKPGDVLVLQEVIGPGTGNPADADPQHRHPVRLTHVEAGYDPLTEQPVVHISWAVADALPFPLCLSALGPAPDCQLIENISIACGNILLVDHGSKTDQDLGEVEQQSLDQCCLGDGMAADVTVQPKRFHPALCAGPLSYCQPVDPGKDKPLSAAELSRQDPRQATPHIELIETTTLGQEYEWQSAMDLLSAQPNDRLFVAEAEDDGITHLRFGNGRSGAQPAAGSRFDACFRIGNGKVGNVGAGAIAHLVIRQGSLSGGIVKVHNPLNAQGGVDPEPVNEVKLFAPHAFRKHIQRAITADDYAHIVEREFKHQVQRAAATLCWNGCGYQVLVAVDQFNRQPADTELLTAIEQCLYRYRRIGHQLVVQSACQVALDIQISVCVLPDYLRGQVKAAVSDVLSNRLLKEGLKGFFHPDNLTFGDSIYLSKLSAIVQAVSGVQSVSVTRLQRCFESPNQELENGVLPLGPLEIARLDNNPSLPENGKLELIMGGGR